MKKKPKAKRLIEWQPIQQFMTGFKAKDRLLAVVATPDPLNGRIFTVLAVEGASENFLDDHAHVNLGEHKTMAAAQRAGERYARKWIAARTKALKCECVQIKI